MYTEDCVSKNLMVLNAYHKDDVHRDKRLIIIKKIWKWLSGVGTLFLSLCKIYNIGIKKFCVIVKAVFCPKTIQNHNIEYSFDHTFELNYQSTGKKINGKVAVYTSIFGGYDTVLEPLYVSDLCDYYIITDQDIPEESVWKKIDPHSIPGFDKMDNYHKSKYCKLMPHVLFPEYEYSVWIDGNVQIVADIIPLIDRLDDSHVMGTFKNPLHDCIYTEKNYLIYKNAVNYDAINTQIGMYEKEGFPKHFGMREFSIIVRKHNDKLCESLMEQWWKQVNTYTMRDQISFPYLLWKNQLSIDYVQLLGENWRDNPRFIGLSHAWRHTFKK